jgi:hypothetical protein
VSMVAGIGQSAPRVQKIASYNRGARCRNAKSVDESVSGDPGSRDWRGVGGDCDSLVCAALNLHSVLCGRGELASTPNQTTAGARSNRGGRGR